MLKNFSGVSSRCSPVSMSTLMKLNSFEEVLDCPVAKVTVFPSGEILLSPILKGRGRVTSFFSFCPSSASAMNNEHQSSSVLGQRTYDIFFPSLERLIQPCVPSVTL